MSVNGITNPSAVSAYDNSYTSTAKTTEAAAETTTQSTATTEANTTGVVYEPSKAAAKTYKPDQALIAKLKADAEARTANLKSIVEQMLTKQGTAYNNANDMWSILSSGDFTVDAATKAQAQEDISEDGYWGVKQTSERILDFAKALTGGDPDKIEEMREAFKKGYEDAQKTWGGELPDICKQTYDAVFEGFDAWAAETNSTTVTETTV
ncbi:MAG: hypothetical protein IJ485_00745 [Lachnospiraceae bacterium]|nr:hypothetical protein [Lachnospiraceae bacterium]